MLEIKYSPQADVSLQGALEDWQDLRQRILDPDWEQLNVDAATGFSPSPYDRILTKIILTKTDDLLDIQVCQEVLQIYGRTDLLELLAENFPYDVVEHDSPIPFHVHFDQLGRSDYMSEAAIGLVLSLRQNDDEKCKS